MEEIKHEAKMDMNKPHMGSHGSHHRPWQNNWKSPVSLGIFLITAAIALTALPIALQSLYALNQEMHPAVSQGMSQQEVQQLMQQQPTPTTASPASK